MAIFDVLTTGTSKSAAFPMERRRGLGDNRGRAGGACVVRRDYLYQYNANNLTHSRSLSRIQNTHNNEHTHRHGPCPHRHTYYTQCRRVPCVKARLRCGRGQVRGVWRRSCRERLAPGLLCRRSVDRSSLLYMWFLVGCAPHDNPPSLAAGTWRE